VARRPARLSAAPARSSGPLGAAARGLGAAALAFAPAGALADETRLFEGEVPEAGAHFELPFDVPAGVAEIEVRHDDLSEVNILDWGLLSPDGFRGYGGGNVEPALVGERAASRSYLPGPLTPGRWRVYVGKAKIAERPARYRVEVVLRDAPTLAPEPARAPYAAWPALRAGPAWYAGDFHVHSRESGDAAPTLEEIASFAESRGLHFVMLADHNTVSQQQWIAQAQAAHPDLLLLAGLELTTYRGHALAIGATRWVDHRLEEGGRTMAEAAADVRAQGALFALAHPEFMLGELCIGCAFVADLPIEAIDGMEVQTGARSITGVFSMPTLRRWEDLVAAGRHVAALGGSDDHRAGRGTGTFDSAIGSPTTLVWARELSAEALVEGIRLGRTVVKLEGPSDPMVELDSPLRAEDSDTIRADVVPLRVVVRDAPENARVRLVIDGVPGASVGVAGNPFVWEPVFEARGRGESFLRAEVLVGSRPRTLTSHLFVRGVTDRPPASDAGATPHGPTGDASGCGCRVVGRPRADRPGAALAQGVAALFGLAGLAARTRRTGARRARPGGPPTPRCAFPPTRRPAARATRSAHGPTMPCFRTNPRLGLPLSRARARRARGALADVGRVRRRRRAPRAGRRRARPRRRGPRRGGPRQRPRPCGSRRHGPRRGRRAPGPRPRRVRERPGLPRRGAVVRGWPLRGLRQLGHGVPHRVPHGLVDVRAQRLQPLRVRAPERLHARR
jgi:hypothetical protein